MYNFALLKFPGKLYAPFNGTVTEGYSSFPGNQRKNNEINLNQEKIVLQIKRTNKSDATFGRKKRLVMRQNIGYVIAV